MIGLVSFLAFTLLVAFIAYFASRSTDETTSDGYFLGGRSLGAAVIAGSLLLTNLSTEQIVGLNGQAFNEGIVVMVWETLAAIAMVVTAVFLLPKYLKGGITTIPQYLEERYDGTTKVMVSALFLSGYVVVLLPIVLYSGAVAFTAMFDIPTMLDISKTTSIWLCVWSIGIIGSVYAIFGGLKAVAVSDTINAIGLLIGGLMIPVFGLLAIGDGSMIDGLNTLTTAHPEKFNAIGSSTSSVPFATIFTGMMLVQLFYWGTNQAIIQRALAASSLKEGQKGLLLGSFLKILGPLLVVLPGIIAWHMFGDNLKISGDEAYPTLVREVLPAPLLGFFAAVIFGAILSSFNSALNSSVTLFGLDIYLPFFYKGNGETNTNATNIDPNNIDKSKPALSKEQERAAVKAGKTFGIGLALMAMVIAPFIANAPDGLFGYLQEVNGCYSIPILTIIVIGFLTKYVPAKAAKVGLILGVILYLISQFILQPYFKGAAEDAAIVAGITDPLQIEALVKGAYPHFLHVMAILFTLNSIIMLAIGKLNPRSVPFVQNYTNQVNIEPWRFVKHAGIIICVIVIMIYIYFSGGATG